MRYDWRTSRGRVCIGIRQEHRPNAVRIENTVCCTSVTVSFSPEDGEVSIGDHRQAVYRVLTGSTSRACFTEDGSTSFDPDAMAARILKDVAPS